MVWQDLDGMASRSTDEQLKEIRELLLLLVPLARSVTNFEKPHPDHHQRCGRSHIQGYQH